MKFADEIDRDKAVIGIAFFRTSELTGLRGLEEPVGIHGRSLLASALKVAVAEIGNAARSLPRRVVYDENTTKNTLATKKRDAELGTDLTIISPDVTAPF